MENTTTEYVIARSTLRSGLAGSASASATEMPPRSPPQVSTCQAPFGKANARLNARPEDPR
jgi:hypothetical protein